jgi:antitoxin component of MazEF toxin-antitoxin module
MVRAFQAKIRHLGNSKGIIIPNEIIEEMDLKLGETITFKVPDKDLTTRNEAIRSMAGIYKGKRRFIRDREEDRY